MGAPEKRRVLQPETPLSVVTGSHARFRALAPGVRAHMPKPRKGASVVRELRRLRSRGSALR